MEIISFYLTSIVLGFVGLGVASRMFRRFADKGYAFTRITGILLISYLSWVFNFLLKLPINHNTILVITVIMLIFSFYLFKGTLLEYFKNNYKILLFEELLFLISFILMLFYRVGDPRIEGIEKFMDYAIINGLFRSEHLPPQDVWFSGNYINYYYFGHFCFAVINKITQIPTSISYNLNVALIFSMVTVSAFSIGFFITKSKIFGIFSALLLTIAGNLDYMVKVFRGLPENYFYADARSIVTNTINEFPAYSFLISDLHAHILNIPFVLLFIACLLTLVFDNDSIKSKLKLFFVSLSLGTLFAVNSWDFVVYAPLFVCAIILYFYLNANKLKIMDKLISGILLGTILSVLSLLFFIFFFIYFKPAVGGVGVSVEFFKLEELFRMFGYFIFAFLPFSIFLYKSRKFELTDKIIIVLFIYGIFLVMLPQIIFLKDIYFKLNAAFFRANTVFKLWYQAWIIFTFTTSYFYLVSIRNAKRYKVLVPILLISIFFTFYVFKYPYVSLKYIFGNNYSNNGLNGISYLEKDYAGDKKIIEWINQNIKGQPVLLEAGGKPYSNDSIFSAYTGLPTIVGWDEHQLGWRDNWPEIAYRLGDIEKMYKSENIAEIQELLDKYEVEYAVISSRERTKYGENAGQLLRFIGNEILSESDSVLLSFN